MSADDDVPITRELCRSVLPTALAIIAFTLAFIGSVQCNAIEFTGTYDGSPITIKFGYWAHEDVSFYTDTSGTYHYAVRSCTRYSSDVEMDAKWRVSAAFSIVALILGGLDFLGICIMKCTLNHWFDCVLYLLAFFFQGLSLLFLDSNACKNNSFIQEINNYNDNATTIYFSEEEVNVVTFPETCSLSQGMRCIIAATVFWGFAAFVSADAYWAKMKRNGEGNNSDLEEALMTGSSYYGRH